MKSADERAAYVLLRNLAVKNPRCSSTHVEALCYAARLKVRYERLVAAVGKLKNYLADAGNGAKRINPLLPELRAVEGRYSAALVQCLLTPRAVTAARQPLGETERKLEANNKGQSAAESLNSKVAKGFLPRVVG